MLCVKSNHDISYTLYIGDFVSLVSLLMAGETFFRPFFSVSSSSSSSSSSASASSSNMKVTFIEERCLELPTLAMARFKLTLEIFSDIAFYVRYM